ncbi:Yhc1p Ecym_3094 [Eremothecium cymbalariae DBVPG|uniref:Matrin-type domain-containing protein n=1 Tax=Eremothecium cymbalariae (strain CBS 270.75 / DBVPG 7215 / KCTC 17166 / NRRL Y-17582) TaxID=931890 RepID=G8JR34_ERECY|nr:Hypothetical protein Ecym_3094 [Eremothecium cymbalariae DBVPG\
MARYYCDYCHSYLTHDTLSVRKSHLIGKNHIRLTADYYYNKANQQKLLFLLPKVSKRRRSRQRCLAVKPPSLSSASEGGSVEPKRVLHCEANKSKRQRRKIRQVPPAVTPLRQIYTTAPGFHKVFTPECRLDIGEMIKVSKLPQRANQKTKLAMATTSSGDATTTTATTTTATTAASGRNKIYEPHYFSTDTDLILPPPPALTVWGITPNSSSLVYRNDDTLKRTVGKLKANLSNPSARPEALHRTLHHTHQRRT